MRRLLLLITLVLVVLAVVYRERLFLRDPLGHIARNGVVQDDARIYINFNNDVLVREKHGTRMFVVQHWNGLEAVPSTLTCVQGMLCLTPSDRVMDVAADTTGRRRATMSDREVSFLDNAGQQVVVTIR